jgi:TetR/AcrR family transcriptional repressor of nem operon
MVTRKGEATKKRILTSATRLIHRGGYKNTTLDDILKDADVKKGSFYFHFDGKDAVAHEVIERFYRFLEGKVLGPICDGEGDALAKLNTFFDLVIADMQENGCVGGCLFGNLALELSDYHEDMRLHLFECFERMRQRFVTIIEEGQTRGEIRDDKGPEELSHFIVATFEGGLLLAKVKKDVVPLTDTKRLVVDFLRP